MVMKFLLEYLFIYFYIYLSMNIVYYCAKLIFVILLLLLLLESLNIIAKSLDKMHYVWKQQTS